MRIFLLLVLVVSLLLPAFLSAGTLTTKDGTVYDGTIKKLGSSYTIKLADGTMKIVAAGDVKSIVDPVLGTDGAAGGAATPGGTAVKPAPGGKPAVGSDDFARTQRQADRVETPLIAVTLWQKFIDTHTAPADIEAGKKELARWQQMAKDGAEKIKGKWVSGDELKKLQKLVNGMMDEAAKQFRDGQSVKGVAKLQEVLKLYPNHFPANFEMGYFYLRKITGVEGSNEWIDKSIQSLETAAKIKPNSAPVLSNLGIAYNFRRRYEDAVISAYKAAQIDETQGTVQNLIMTLEFAPEGMRRNNPKVKPIVADAMVMASRHGVSKGGFVYLRPTYGTKGGESDDDGPDKSDRKGIVGSGTGFFISDTGYIMTNRHVAAAGDKLIIRMSDATQKVATVVVIDDEQDIAILKLDQVKGKPFPYIKLAEYQVPPVGTDVTVMGFPLGQMMGMHVKITRGVVTSIEDGKKECDVIVDAQVNPGNSGGPMLDKYGNLLALVAMKTFADERVSSYGLGISTGRLRKFFEHQKEKLGPVIEKLEAGKKGATPLTTEEIAEKFTQATVMVLMVNGELPDGLKD